LFDLQAELEHRNPKSRYTRTSRKGFVKQLTQIERRQARIREEHMKANRAQQEIPASNPEVPYNIGKSQNNPVDLAQFLQKHVDDPVTQVS
jgi:hypothetical protein